MISDRLSGTASRRRRSGQAWRAPSGEPLTLLLIAVSIAGGIALAIACSYRPIALWWVMVGCSAINVVRFGARLLRQSRADRPGAPTVHSPLVALIARALVRSLDAFAGAGSGRSKASLDRQHARFLVWFTEHNLLWTMIGFGVSLLLWYRFGPTAPALVVMAALMACAIFAALGAAVGARTPTLGLCWREPCRTPNLWSLRRLVHDIGCVVVLTNRRDYAARCDWAKGGRFHELFLTVDDLARAGVEPGLEAVLAADDATVRRALARKERLDRAVALTPVLAAGLLAALLAVPPLAGSEPLPSLWTILTRTATPQARASGDGHSGDLPSGSAASSDARQARKKANDPSSSQSSRANGDATSSATRTGPERPDLTGQGGEGSITGDAVASARGDSTEAASPGAGAPGGEAGAGRGSSGSGGGSSSGEDGLGGSGGRGGGPRGYGTGGVAPQRAESPAALPDAPLNPGKAIEVVLPAFSQARDDSPGDDPMGTKRKAKAPDQAQADRVRRDSMAAPNEPATREPVQRWPNWVFQLLHK